jgi:transcriptional regulator with XRE-family HTH domain
MNTYTFAKNLKALREARGLDLATLAVRVGVKTHCIASYESGMRMPTVETLARLQEELQVGADLMLTSDLRKFPMAQVRAALKSMTPRKAVLYP